MTLQDECDVLHIHLHLGGHKAEVDLDRLLGFKEPRTAFNLLNLLRSKELDAETLLNEFALLGCWRLQIDPQNIFILRNILQGRVLKLLNLSFPYGVDAYHLRTPQYIIILQKTVRSRVINRT